MPINNFGKFGDDPVNNFQVRARTKVDCVILTKSRAITLMVLAGYQTWPYCYTYNDSVQV